MSKELLSTHITLDPNVIQRGEREGIELDKGVILTPPYLEKNFDLFTEYAIFLRLIQIFS